jgi:hypothetical protein
MSTDDGLVGVQIREDIGEVILAWIETERARRACLPDLRGRMGLAIVDRLEQQLYALAEGGSEHAPMIAFALWGHCRAQLAETEIARRDQIECATRGRDRDQT